ncbi:uncharacterized protein BYT42DRAFT_604206 [Radiomyces spectabilis]|uniref:uncharacterized protein n=1 Tax=Radiomyces spectabilis TaxID=64574 RepID=UPI00221E6BDA|nr:uncharacterized protein BYT42DRAFT_604206 [Radiomyces spectabilis]KAI8381198.1 hypothetical protein BYT42DRAFT_604206 [Radiomyces spectabilis]
MATSVEQQTAHLFKELERTSQEYDDERSLEICDQLVKLSPDDPLALQCKVVAFIRLEKYTEALSLIARKFRDSQVDLSFEKIYCYYRTNQLRQAIDLLSEVKHRHTDNLALAFLEAQILYAQDRYKEAIEAYEVLLDKTDKRDRLYDEIQVNLLAAKASLKFTQLDLEDMETVNVGSSNSGLYEMAYNAASVHLANGDLKKAKEQLETARSHCSEKMTEAGMSREEIDEELAAIAAQLAYTYQLQGRTDEATEIYESVLSSSANDANVKAVVSNNIAAIRQTNDLFDVAKKLKTATGKEADTKLRRYQKRVIAGNEALLQLYQSKYAACRDAAQKLLDKYPNDDKLYLILAAATYHQHKAEAAVDELKKYAEKNPASLAIRFATIQLQLLSSQPAAALTVLTSYLTHVGEDNKKDFYQPAVVALLVWLYEQTGQSEKAMETLDKASLYWKTDKALAFTTSTSILKQTATFKLKSGRYQDAVSDFEQLVKADPTDLQSLAGLIAVYAEVDPVKAEQYGEALPGIAMDHVDVDTLERIVPGVKRGYVKKEHKSGVVKKPKEKKKRKPLLPKKNYDPNQTPDPERWLPARERSTYRVKGKNKKAANKGPQGAAVSGGGIGGTGSAKIAGRHSPVVETPEEKPATQTPPASTPAKSSTSSKKKKKGKGKSKW